jgi:putative membrane protein
VKGVIMPENTEDGLPVKARNRRVHFANERTFLSWIRTSVGIMAFGFVVEKFGLFVRQVSYFLAKSGHLPAGEDIPSVLPSASYSSILGLLLVGLGALMALLAFIRYKKVEKQIDEDSYRPSLILDALLTLSVLGVAIFLMLYLFHSI